MNTSLILYHLNLSTGRLHNVVTELGGSITARSTRNSSSSGLVCTEWFTVRSPVGSVFIGAQPSMCKGVGGEAILLFIYHIHQSP